MLKQPIAGENLEECDGVRIGPTDSTANGSSADCDCCCLPDTISFEIVDDSYCCEPEADQPAIVKRSDVNR